MKMQRNVGGHNVKAATKAEGTAAASTVTIAKKKGKRPIEKVENERKNSDESSPVMVENLLGWEDQWPWLMGIVDEQMSWGSIWLPIWDVKYMGEACSEMFSDVVWDDDVWNLTSINKIPNP